MFYLDGESIVVSGAVHRALNDVVGRMTENSVSGWQGNYKIFLDHDGQIEAKPTEQNKRGGFQSGLTSRLVFVPTPEWVKDSNQKLYICFANELDELMRKWWGEFSLRL